ncbi:CPBP family intramembrane glutamic endopeptidase [Streptococcus loxodontisalivarius]|uniref:Membrane protease YdiL (CAAX protease family) n=1 Tax=Streptococcus loxodontisalivarius TaxID=1349415 RepID=A0ABS2PR65_9STRE|nr:type II CAAX endopeptidase family protein [Streptococcus loxodontisalivarius]MBM7641989.1 membrane protease YdiL (CAAX protease family) [Streptococcus loxodontisalivarius]
MRFLKLSALIVVTILLSLVIQMPTYLGITLFDENLVLKLTVGLLAFLVTLTGLLLLRAKSFPNIPIKEKLSLKLVFGWTLLTVLLIIGIKSIMQFFGVHLTSANNDDLIQQLRSHNMLFMMVNLHLLGPILEEIVFRGLLLEGLLRLYPKKQYTAIFLSAFLFAFAHTYTLSLSLLDYFIFGFLYSSLYYQSRHLRNSVLAHILTNSLITLLSIIAGLLLQ